MLRRWAYGVGAVIGLWAAALSAGAAPATRPAADEVMKPTQRGVRMTPALARTMARWWMQQDLWQRLELNVDQEKRVQDLLARRYMEQARSRGQESQPVVEYLLEVMIDTQGFRRPPTSTPEVGQRAAPVVQLTRDFFDGVPALVEPALDPEQRAKLAEGMKSQKQALDRIEDHLKRMANGEEQTNWNFWRDLGETFGEAAQAPEPEKRPMQRARREAERTLRQIGVAEWMQLLRATETTFKFDDAQKARAEAILAKHMKEVEALMTPEWKAGVRECLVWRFAEWELGDMPKQPWAYRWERRMETLYQPLRDLGWGFQDELLAVATPEQWANAAAELRRYAEEQGLPATERPGEPQNLLARELQARHN